MHTTGTRKPAATETGGGTDTDSGTEGGPGGGAVATWEAAAGARAASRARAFTAETLRRWDVTGPSGANTDANTDANTGADTDADDVVLIVDELVTNAVVHGAGPVRLTLRLDGGVLTGEVADAAPAAPAVPAAPPGVLDWSEAGRGLLLVEALATGFGTRLTASGKTVWFTRRLAAPGGRGGAAVPAPRPPEPEVPPAH